MIQVASLSMEDDRPEEGFAARLEREIHKADLGFRGQPARNRVRFIQVTRHHGVHYGIFEVTPLAANSNTGEPGS